MAPKGRIRLRLTRSSGAAAESTPKKFEDLEDEPMVDASAADNASDREEPRAQEDDDDDAEHQEPKGGDDSADDDDEGPPADEEDIPQDE